MEPIDNEVAQPSVMLVCYEKITALHERTGGWYVQFGGEPISTYIGDNKGNWRVGDVICITMQAVSPEAGGSCKCHL
jgi:hypothetical protein